MNSPFLLGIHKKDILAWLEKQKSVGEIVERCKTSWYNEGKIQGQIEGLSDEEKYQQGWHDALEKQGEQKPADKVESKDYSSIDPHFGKPIDKQKPKFHEGDWVILFEHNDSIYQVERIDNYRYYLRHYSGYTISPHFDRETIRLWTIKDTKPGDVLSSEDKDKVFLYNGKLDLRGRVCAYCGIYKTYDGLRFTKCAIGNHFTYKEPYPATKEQRDLLFQKMKESGYEWDADKKELKKIEQKSVDTVKPKFRVGDTMRTRQEASDGITDGLPVVVSIDEEYYHCNNELIAIKDQDDYEYPPMNRKQNTAWSEEDEHRIDDTIYFIETAKKHYASTVELDACIDWLKSLKDRYVWKPSDEQVKALRDLNLTGNISYAGQGQTLIELYNDLKKLKG